MRYPAFEKFEIIRLVEQLVLAGILTDQFVESAVRDA